MGEVNQAYFRTKTKQNIFYLIFWYPSLFLNILFLHLFLLHLFPPSSLPIFFPFPFFPIFNPPSQLPLPFFIFYSSPPTISFFSLPSSYLNLPFPDFFPSFRSFFIPSFPFFLTFPSTSTFHFFFPSPHLFLSFPFLFLPPFSPRSNPFPYYSSPWCWCI